MFSNEHLRIYFGEDDGHNITEANDFMKDIGDNNILNPLMWFELYNKNKVVYDLVFLGCSAAKNMSQPPSLVGGNSKGLDLVNFLFKMEMRISSKYPSLIS